MIRKPLERRALARLFTALLAAAAIGLSTAAVTASALTSLLPSTGYTMLGAHPMLTAQGYKNAYKGTDFIPGVASEPYGGKMIYGGGPVITHPKMYLTFWDWTSDPAGIKPYLTGFLRGVGGSNWLDSQTQYCQHVTATATGCDGGDPIVNAPNQLAGVWDDNADLVPANPIAEPQTGDSPPLADEAVRAVHHFGYDPNGVYFIATPHGHSTAGFASNNGTTGYCAWHGGLELADGSYVRFVNMPYITDAGASCGQNLVNPGTQGLLDPVSVASGHEYAETITDPNGSFAGIALAGETATGWYDPDPIGAETGDKCAYPLWDQAGLQGSGLPGEAVDITLNGKPYAVQPLWSNNANDYTGQCVTSYTPPSFSIPSLPSIPGAAADNLAPASCPGAQVSDRAFDALDPYTTLNLASSNQPSLDILNVQFSTPKADTLEIKTTLDNLQPFPQGDTLGGTWSVYWDYGGQTYVASVASDATGTVYEDGVHTSSPVGVLTPTGIGAGTSGNSDTYNNTDDTGSFNSGPNGTVIIDVPLSHVGSPPAGSVLTKTWAVSYGEVANAVNSSVPAIPGAGNHVVVFPSDEAPDNNPVSGGPYIVGPYTGWAYQVGAATNCSTVRALPAPPIDTIKPVAPPALACGDLWANPDHTASDILGNSAPQLTLERGSMTMSADGKTLQVKMTIKDLEATVPAGATGEDWYMTWDYKGTLYFSQVQLSAVPTSAPQFSDGTVSVVSGSHQYNPANTDTGSFTPGPNGVVEVDVPLANVGSPPAAAVLKQPVGETDTEYGVPGNPATGGAGSLQKVDTGGPNRDFTVGSSCVKTAAFAASTSKASGSGGSNGSGGAGQALARTGLPLLGLLLGLLLVAAGTATFRSRRTGAD